MNKPTTEEMLEWTCKIHELFPDDINIIYTIRSILSGEVDEEWLKEKAGEIANNYPDIAFPNLIPIIRNVIHDWLESKTREKT